MCLLPVIWTHSSTEGWGRLCSKTVNVFGTLSKIPKSPFFKADLCQQADPHRVGSSSGLISTQLIGVVGAKNLHLCVCVWERDSPGADAIITTVLTKKGCLCLLLSSLYSPVTLQSTASLLLWQVSVLGVIQAGFVAGYHSLWGLWCPGWWQKGTVALALLLCCLPRSPWAPLACPAQPSLPVQVLLAPRLGLSLHTQRLFPSLQPHHALLTWLVPHTGQQETNPCAAAVIYNFACMVHLTSTPSGPALHLQLSM